MKKEQDLDQKKKFLLIKILNLNTKIKIFKLKNMKFHLGN